MRLASSGKINTSTILTAISFIGRHFTPCSLPICVDFDHVFDFDNPSRCIARSNIDNPTENLFYITKTYQSVLNQVEAGVIAPGRYFALLPCKSLEIENSHTYANNLAVTAFIVSHNDETDDLISSVLSVYDLMGVTSTTRSCNDKANCTEFFVNGVPVGRVVTVEIGDLYASVATVLHEPVFSYATSLLK
ncbi:hypothetical protein [Citrobacter phage Tr1]|nr:hypothetical protein [Citrobacter phage Tr1]